MVPKEWKLGSVSDLAETVMGFAFKSNDFTKSGIPLLRMGNLYQNKLNFNRNPILLPDHYRNEYKRFIVKSGDLVMSMTGTMGKRDYGFTVEIPPDAPDSLLNQRVIKLIPKENSSSGYLLNLLRSEYILSRLYAFPGGTKQANLSAKQLQELPAPVPPLPEQQKIAKILSTWDKAISTTEKLITTSQQQKKALMQQLLTGKKRLCSSPKGSPDTGMVFEGDWEEVKLNQCLSMMKSGLSRKLESENIGIAVMRSNNIGERYTSDDDLKYWYLNDPQGAKVENYILDNGDILVNFINSLSQIGKTCIYKKKNTLDAIYTTNLLRLKADESIVTSDFLFYLTKTQYYKNSVQSITKPAVNQASFTTNEFGQIKFMIPIIKEQQKIASVLTAADKEIALLDAKLTHLKQEKKALMQQLLTGKRRVKVEAA